MLYCGGAAWDAVYGGRDTEEAAEATAVTTAPPPGRQAVATADKQSTSATTRLKTNTALIRPEQR